MRILILALLVYLLYRVLKGFLVRPQETSEGAPEGGQINTMVQDPQCGTYIAMRDATKRSIRGKTLFFCSEACADAYEREQREQEEGR
jgi:YHS domain-containing protein